MCAHTHTLHMFINADVHIQQHIYICTHMYPYIHIHTCIHTHVHTHHVFMYVHAYMHTCIHTHSHSSRVVTRVLYHICTLLHANTHMYSQLMSNRSHTATWTNSTREIRKQSKNWHGKNKILQYRISAMRETFSNVAVSGNIFGLFISQFLELFWDS